ncbi:putative ABC transport system substrate-binding protein [Desulfocicer vacuolatum DSM 3385]|uniref:Putative ABC transport system substrate-binding protein n=1 Tax=Desulfocicer vacuolatum DSM 3385 TaxID=1121400 RepID=A0A1W2BW39_9BACT|nr:ABC transporter substrate binding protein [Desulfocicer vacuolatum]SMC76964.1 putative ABC transport system substrate-binding protein [Desulfocicer vacuolatum DSM 3385]
MTLQTKEPSNINIKKFALFLLVLFFLFPNGVAYCEEKSIAVLVSKKIKPYMQVLKGVKQRTSHTIEIYFLSQNSEKQKKIKQKLLAKPYDLFLTIGPEATALIWSMKPLNNKVKMFSAVLDSHKILARNIPDCGISLQIPVSTQLEEINTALPNTKKIGLLFDKKHNTPFFKKAIISGKEKNLNLIPFSVGSKKEIPHILKENLSKVDCIWMIPDQTVISERIVQYVIKQALYQKKGVIGFNSFFMRSGAVFAFIFDYLQIGIQTAEKINNYFIQEQCDITPPNFEKKINFKIAQTLGIKLYRKK